MSLVTNCILHFSIIEDEANRIKDINSFFDIPEHKQKPFVDIDDPSLPFGWYGGSKRSKASLFYGAFNYLDLDSLCLYIKSIKFLEPDNVQLIIQRQTEDRFSIINVFEDYQYIVE